MKYRFIKHLFSICTIILLLTSLEVSAQYANGWIDYSKTYWKFKVGSEGVIRLTKADLDAAGLPSTINGADLVLYRGGKEVSLFTTTVGSLAASDYIEFYGTANDGVLDKELYLKPNKYTNENISLFNDSASYFLTIDNSNPHLRLVNSTVAIPPSPPTAAGYCWANIISNGRNQFSNGKTNGPLRYDISGIVELYASQFDYAEGYIFNWNLSANPASITIATPNLVSTAANARLRTASLAIAKDSNHKLSVYINNNLLADSTYGISDVQHFDMSFPSTLLTSSNTLKFEHRQTGNADVFGVPYWSIDYPRDWDFSGSNFIKFKVNAATSAQYLEINNFVHGGTAPKLYDLTNNKWYLGDISFSGKTRFLIDAAMTQSEMVLFANTSSKIIKPQFVQQRIFTDYNNASNQGDYLIITHKNLMKPYAGKNQIDEYKNYRNSVAGGAHKTVVADVEELYDQFAYGTDQHPLAISQLIDFGLVTWSTKPNSVFLIGKGVTYEIYKTFIASSSVANYEGIVPTYGTPGSDLGFVTDRVTWKMKMPIGRLSAWNTEEVANYLNKVKQYEASLAPASFPTPSTELWKKQVLHLAGGDGTPAYPGLQSGTLLPTLNAAKSIIEAPNTGAFTATYAKDTKGLPTTINDKKVDSLINNGISMITYYGHGSAERLDYEIKAPSEYNTLPRIPIFSAFGCDIST
ncbi:MAG: hypothetical protein IT256_00135, partial [Chitinophagaceae bacterium]|nr:hypothetical protein [Chitinophagaceae bacterium]